MWNKYLLSEKHQKFLNITCNLQVFHMEIGCSVKYWWQGEISHPGDETWVSSDTENHKMNLYKHPWTWIIALKLQYRIFETTSFNLRLWITLNSFETCSVALETCLSSLFHHRINLSNSPIHSDCATCVISCVFRSYYHMHTYLFTRSIFSVILDLYYFRHLRLHFLFIYLQFSICFIDYLSLGHHLQAILLYLHVYHRLFICSISS